MAAAYASLVSLMRLIHDLQHHPFPPITLDSQLLDSIAQRVTYFQEFLRDYNSNSVAEDDEDEAPDPLEMRIAGAAYAAEDAIESHIVDYIKHKSDPTAFDEKNPYAALVSLMQIIQELYRFPSPPIFLDKHLLDSITQHVTYFQEFLGDEEEAADPLEMCIGNTANAAKNTIIRLLNCFQSSNELKSIHLCLDRLQCVIEEMDSIKKVVVHDPLEMRIESHIVESIEQHCAETRNANAEKIESINLCHDCLQSVIEEMDLIKKMVDTENKTKKVPVVHGQVEVMTNGPTSVICKETMAGSDDQVHTTSVLGSVARNEIMEKLVQGHHDFQVIPIGGMGGIGKTFLAKTIYRQRHIKDRFDICAWATISQQYNTREILCELLSQATNTKKEELSEKSEDVLGMDLYKYLFPRRFLIVMDDIWSIDAWDKIQHYFPDKKNGSRVLVTTRLFQLCSQLNSNYSFPMSFLDEASSWDLFSRTVFGEKSCPPVLKEIADKIADNCRGLPLSIVVVGGLLKKMDGTLGSWESIRDNVSSVVNMQNDERCLRLLKLSYNHLPIYLKPCFLYMGVFEEDKEIRVSRLVKQWVSEGFLQSTNGESSETTARGFLQDLVHRNLILIGKIGSTGSIKSCKIHDLLRDMCLKESQKDGFYHVIGQSNPPPRGMNTLRRVVIPRNTLQEKVSDGLRWMPYARSVICEDGKVPPFENGLLRILHADKLDSFVRYVNLRRLSIQSCRASLFVPYVSILWNLHTLIVNDSYSPHLLVGIWKMPQFRHIEFVKGFWSLPDPPRVVRDEDVVIMENLHTLKGVLNFKFSEDVVKRIPNIKKLKLEYRGLPGTDNQDEHCVGNIKSLCGLESLSVSHVTVPECNVYMQKLTFPQSLKKLRLWMPGGLEWDDMLETIGSLPLLEKLQLSGGCFGRGKWETEKGQFPSLKYLGLSYCFLEHWTASEDDSSILPRLQQLHLSLYELKEIPLELGNIDTLKSIMLSYCEEEAVRSVKEMFDEQVELQGGEDQLCFHVDVTVTRNQHHLLSLAGPNFCVKKGF